MGDVNSTFKRVQNEIDRFLSTEIPEVLCISGEWGVGKTFTWNTMLEGAKKNKTLKFNRYSYVSLFGINSLEAFKSAITENIEFLNLDGTEEGIAASAKISLGRLFNKFSSHKQIISKIPTVREFLQAFDQYLFSTVNNQIICVDDLERKGDALSIKDVLGLISFLREERKCKIVILFNEEKINDNSDEFNRFSEKVIDAVLKFQPSPRDSVGIALRRNDEASKLISENCIKLGISNIRVIKKIERFVCLIKPAIKDFDNTILRQTIHSLTLFVWSKNQAGIAPTLEYLKTKRSNQYHGLLNKEEISKEEATWSELLDAYDFLVLDELDKALLVGVENGFFDFDEIKNYAAELNNHTRQQKQHDSFRKAWRLYYDSFFNNETEVVEAIYDSFKENVKIVSPMDLTATVNLFTALKYKDKSKELINFYTSEREDGPEFWEWEKHEVFPGDVLADDVKAAFDAKRESFAKERLDPVETLLRIAEHESWGEGDIKGLVGTTVDEYYNIFKKLSGHDLHRIISISLKFGQTQNATNEMIEISKRVKAALFKIGKESRINALRVRKFGINVDDDDAGGSH